ncbi:Opr family porin [Aliarcobacter butzleri]|uniref:Opr family porin n=3 Tax=Aliarcobacter butzleri TaxID=28197 RepID=UPI00125F0D49|nr:Opr family porin [Aliarcobacter butzleri]MCG3686395.1 Opr family porin [Aliarcobacter butzleri]MCG3696024.1 Opr family porin [Aliarcobacter butzleri]MCG3700128.1 Opr family porin [Aliarcobacter butzleri]MDK2081478.1 Opr family porin [Aliarcobacter butzleri]MDN5080672.1 Opr family porin [Aliarcobacter butzleri]
MKRLSLITCGLVLSSSFVFANEVKTFDDAFKSGKASGSLGLYGKHIDYSGTQSSYDPTKQVGKAGYLNGNATIGYETASLYGFSAKAEFKGNLDLGEINNDDRKSGIAPFENNALMTEGYLKYANDAFFVSAGRQAIDLEWLSDYHEAVVAGITAVPDTTIVLGWTKRKAESTAELSEDFWKINENKGAYVADIKYAGFTGVELNPYYYSAPDLADWYGLKTTFSTDYFGVVAHYAASNEDVQDVEDGSIAHVELNTEIDGFTAAVGYIKTDKDGGTGTMSAAGDNISPFEDGNYNYGLDAKTVYGSLGYTIADVTFGALYGQTDYDYDTTVKNLKEKELNLSVGYAFTESLSTSVLYVNVDADSNEPDYSDYDKWIATIEYTF